MSTDFEFFSATDHPALVALATPEWQSAGETALAELGYKTRTVQNHAEFPGNYSSVLYEVVLIDQLFASTVPEENTSLRLLQEMPMARRRHSTIFLLGDSFETLNTMQAFQQSVHAVVNYAELALLGQIVQKVVADNTLFLHSYRDTTERLIKGQL
ncbi:MAG: hypothetical protein H7X97_00060 [Opitutaceae bacterium]|nr:hypothetical protein [Verrucomicrobiales bacterium]